MAQPSTECWDIAVIGGGIVGLAVARSALRRGYGRVLVLEKEQQIAQHQSSRNSGVLHAGLYYRPGSLKATTCRVGKRLMEEFCQQHSIPWERCGKIVVATHAGELPRLEQLAERGRMNGVELEPIDAAGIVEREPSVVGIAGLHVRETGIVDFAGVCAKLAAQIVERGGDVRPANRLCKVEREGEGLRMHTDRDSYAVGWLINCGGLHCDTIYRLCGGTRKVRIIPFRGEYYDLKEDRQGMIRNLVYPVPDPAFPFLGVHFTRMARGGVECGPNAVLALAREGYSWKHIRAGELWGTLSYPGFRKLATRYYRTGMGEIWRSVSKPAFVKALRRLVPTLRGSDLVRGRAGVRAQAVAEDGSLIEDFLIETTPRAVHVLNAPSPAATASLAIAEHVLDVFQREST